MWVAVGEGAGFTEEHKGGDKFQLKIYREPL